MEIEFTHEHWDKVIEVLKKYIGKGQSFIITEDDYKTLKEIAKESIVFDCGDDEL